MICTCCPDCRVRFSPAATAYLDACPSCGQRPEAASSLEAVVGFQLMGLAVPFEAADSAALVLPVQIPDPAEGRR